MSMKVLATAILCAFLLCGCQSVPPIPAGANVSPDMASGEDPYEGWLFNRITGRERPVPGQAVPADAARPAGEVSLSGVIPASAVQALPPTPTPSYAEAARAAEADRVAKADGEDSGFDLSDLNPENIVKNIKKATGFGPDEGLARKHMAEGEAAFKEAVGLYREAEGLRATKQTDDALDAKKSQAMAKFKQAEASFKSAAGRQPDSLLQEDAMFLRAECQFFSDQYAKAQDGYDNLLEKYKNTRYLDTVVRRLFAIGRYWEGLQNSDPHWPVTPNVTDSTRPLFDTFGNALKTYESVRMHDPTGPLADDSIMATATAFYKMGRYEDAAYQYDLLRKEYPKSEHQVHAHMLGLDCKMRVYQGSRYDRAPLDEAKEIAEQTLLQFPRQLGAGRATVEKTRAQITAEMASRDFAMAEYYDNRRCYGAARIYYKSVFKEYPGTPHAERAVARLEEIKDKPDNPPNHFKWLTNLFPDG